MEPGGVAWCALLLNVGPLERDNPTLELDGAGGRLRMGWTLRATLFALLPQTSIICNGVFWFFRTLHLGQRSSGCRSTWVNLALARARSIVILVRKESTP